MKGFLCDIYNLYILYFDQIHPICYSFLTPLCLPSFLIVFGGFHCAIFTSIYLSRYVYNYMYILIYAHKYIAYFYNIHPVTLSLSFLPLSGPPSPLFTIMSCYYFILGLNSHMSLAYLA
jgi:hypothetical protein